MLREKRTFWRKLLSLPSWERGLKSSVTQTASCSDIVAPLVGAWIEMQPKCSGNTTTIAVAPLVGAWIEISGARVKAGTAQSLPSWERGLKSYQTG